MLLLVDVGNSSVKWRLTPADDYKPIGGGILTFDRLEELKKFADIPHKAVASVKPSVNPALERILKNPCFVSVEDCKPLIGIDYKTPSTLGIDRLLNAIGGLEYGNTFAVVSFGTATVVDLILEKTFKGGVIFLGVEKHLECLAKKGEKLPEVEPKNNPPLLGQSTAECLQSGVFYSQIFTAKGLLENFKTLYGVGKVILTGGYADFFHPQIGGIIDKELLFRGLFRVYKTAVG